MSRRLSFIRPPQPARDYLRLPMVRVVMMLLVADVVFLAVLWIRGLS